MLEASTVSFATDNPPPIAILKRRRTTHAHKETAASTPQEIMDCMAQAKTVHPNDAKAQLEHIIQNVRIPSATGQGPRKGRAVSNRTKQAYFEAMAVLISTLIEVHTKPRNLDDISLKNVRAAVRHWESNGLSAATMACRYSCIKRFMNLVGKGTLFPPIRQLAADENNVRRQYSAIEPKAGRDADQLEEVIAEVRGKCVFTGAMLLLSREFGLRIQEALMLRPHFDVRSDVLAITRGAKGGKGRLIPIENDRQKAAIELSKPLVNPKTGTIGPYPTLAQNRSRVYYVLKACGMDKKTLGATAHGLRHLYLNESYERLAGVPSPVNGGPRLSKARDLQIRQELSLRSGHVRTDIVSAYIGSSRNIDHANRVFLKELVHDLENCQPLAVLMAKARQHFLAHGLNLNLHITGDSVRTRVRKDNQILSAALLLSNLAGQEAECPDALQPAFFKTCTEIAMVARRHAGRTLAILPFGDPNDKERFEVCMDRGFAHV